MLPGRPRPKCDEDQVWLMRRSRGPEGTVMIELEDGPVSHKPTDKDRQTGTEGKGKT